MLKYLAGFFDGEGYAVRDVYKNILKELKGLPC